MTIIHLMVILLIGCTIVSEIYFRKDIAFWTGLSGFTKLDKSIEIVNFLGLFISILMLIPIIYLLYSNNIYLSLSIVNIAAILALIQLYFAINLYAYPNNFINQMLPKWKKKLNTLDIIYMEMKFWCCGYQFTNQFIGDNCTVSPLPCASQLVSFLAPTIRATGKTFFIHSLLNFIVSIAVFSISKTESEIRAEAHNFKRLSILNEVNNQQNSLLLPPGDEGTIEDFTKSDKENQSNLPLKDVPLETIEIPQRDIIINQQEMFPLKEH